MASWNREHAKGRRYTETWLFARDCREAYRRVSGRELVWRGATRDTPEPRGLQPGAATFAEVKEETRRGVRELESGPQRRVHRRGR